MYTKTLISILGFSLLTACVTAKQVQTTNTPSTLETNLKSDESVLLFPTNAHYDSAQKKWIIPVHGWVFEPEHDSLWRNTMIKTFEKFIGVKKDTPEEKRFRERTRMFLVDNERSKDIVLSINRQPFIAPTTGANGHFEFDAQLNPAATCDRWLGIQVVTPGGDMRKFSGQAQCVKSAGISVISDIDDTIKDSNVLDKKALMQNTFMKEFHAVNGMSRIYRQWHKQGHQFHYVSSSPWQLYPALRQFLQNKLFPAGSMHLKLVRLKDKSLFSLFDSPEDGKIPTITRLMNTYPQRKFFLVGDSGEKDPEIYAEIARRYPGRVVRIFIRDIRNDRQRLAKIFSGLNKKQWVAFRDTKEILNQPSLLASK